MSEPRVTGDLLLSRYDESELRIASEFLTNWLPFLSRDLCPNCSNTLSHRIRALSLPKVNGGKEVSTSGKKSLVLTPNNDEEDVENCDTHSLGSWKDEAECNSLSSGKDGMTGCLESSVAADASTSEVVGDSGLVVFQSPKVRMSWADMAQEDELEGEGDSEESKQYANGEVLNGESSGEIRRKTELSREQREYLRFMNVRRKKDFICLQRVNGKVTNIVQGLELHTGVFSAVEQKRIVDHIYELQEKGRKGELKERTFQAPKKWMKGKGRVTIQFGCCYNYATDKNGNPPGILKKEAVDPLPPLFKVIIKRLIRWHVLPPSCVPDSCIVNIYDEGDCIPPHIDNHDFVRPFCTISFLSECNILFGTELKIEGPGEFSGDLAIPLPVGSVLVLNGNGADVAKHCVPAVPTKRISVTFRRMDDSKRPVYFTPEPDLQGLEPLNYEDEGSNTPSSAPPLVSRKDSRGGFRSDRKRPEGSHHSDRRRPEERRFSEGRSEEPRYSERRRSEEPHHLESTTPEDSRFSERRRSEEPHFSERKRPEEPRYSARNRGSMRGPRTKVNLGGS